jgi:hypothetical protein
VILRVWRRAMQKPLMMVRPIVLSQAKPEEPSRPFLDGIIKPVPVYVRVLSTHR